MLLAFIRACHFMAQQCGKRPAEGQVDHTAYTMAHENNRPSIGDASYQTQIARERLKAEVPIAGSRRFG